jgi:polyphosphate kinase
MNTLQDFACADLLYLAATAGVQVDLLVRGICIARPNLPELQGRLVVTSVVGRFLEHSRVFYFRNGGDDELYLGSADLMPRNLDRRVETLFPIRDAAIKQSIKEGLLEPFMRDTVHARRLLGNGQYQRVQPQLGQAPFDVQRWLLDTTRQESEAVTPLRALPRSEAPAVLPAPD